MNRKLLITIAVLTLLGLAVVVSAKMTMTSSDTLSSKADYNVEISIEKGWNLIVRAPLLGSYENDDTPDSVIDSDSEIKQGDIKAIYYYFRYENKYLQVYPNAQEVINYGRNAQEKPGEAFYFAQSPVWVYSSKSGILKYSRHDFPKSGYPALSAGWNFLTITPEMKGVYFKDLKGDCNIQKIASYQGDSWRVISDSADANKNIDAVIVNDEQQVGLGIVIKVSNDCTMGISEGEIPSAPVLP